MQEEFGFEKLDVYHKSKALTKGLLILLKYNSKIDFFLKDQLKRASTSIMLNIAEGSGRYTITDRKHFYVMARGSVYETVAILQILLDIDLITPISYTEFRSKLIEIAKMLTGLIKIN